MRVGIPKETWPGETRVAVIPAGAVTLKKAGLDVAIEQGAGAAAGFPDDAYEKQGVAVISRSELFQNAEIVLQVRSAPIDARLQKGQSSTGLTP